MGAPAKGRKEQRPNGAGGSQPWAELHALSTGQLAASSLHLAEFQSLRGELLLGLVASIKTQYVRVAPWARPIPASWYCGSIKMCAWARLRSQLVKTERTSEDPAQTVSAILDQA